ncbi:NAD(P)H-dependent oxidoreductase [Sphingomonas cannabina]|uniref:NAD(P)H-dependent oxidoreductase n=1 Tax=Sphingomonas cannabina TaxID=2899123 RepID=UPI001F47B9DA|nr:NAD(P)H-dependent oxidoreductase [Sphingomonas cannabina]UIJ44176.1 NAD(P)H-dependent oxidoreductase [Sphingomonas cannabina]
MAEFDGYILVTAEYNRGVLAVLRNALDYAYPGRDYLVDAALDRPKRGNRRRRPGRAIAAVPFVIATA